jgi:hypothetical protein
VFYQNLIKKHYFFFKKKLRKNNVEDRYFVQKSSASTRFQAGKLLALETVLVSALDLGSHAQVIQYACAASMHSFFELCSIQIYTVNLFSKKK